MATSREEVLADFQACTGIEDVGECILHLEETNWNLLEAINRVMPQETQTLPSEQVQGPRNRSATELVDLVEEQTSRLQMPVLAQSQTHCIGVPAITPYRLPIVSSSTDDIIPLPSTSQPHIRLLNFTVEFRDRTVPLVVPDTETVATLKTLLYSEFGIPPCKQDIRGWRSDKVNDHTKLSNLNLPKDNSLYMMAPEIPMEVDSAQNGEDSTIAERRSQTFKLNIVDETNHKEYSVNFNGTKTIKQVKQDIFSLTDIPVRNQQWSGWPATAKDDGLTLAGAGISYPCHSLVVRRAATLSTSKKLVVDLAGSDSSNEEEFEDASESFNMDDDMFAHDSGVKKTRSLMPDNVSGEVEALMHFTTEFSNRYGDCYPMFFQGSLDDALKEACLKPARERKLLAIYLHHDDSVLANVFCTQLLCSETVVSYLSNNFITWSWDLTHESNRAYLLALVTRHFGSVAAQTIRNFKVEQLPLFLIIMRSRSATEVFTIIHGSTSLDELMTSLIHSVDVFTSQLHIDMREEDEREARESVKREQDLAYEASLQADRIKAEAKKVKEEQRVIKEREEEIEKERESEMLKQAEAVKLAIRQSLKDQLPPEPPEESLEALSRIKFRLPSGTFLTRRFYSNEPLENLLNFLITEGYHTTEYKVLSSWPRRDLTTLNPFTSLQALQLYPQETITLEER